MATIENEKLRNLCIENGWFDDGSNSQYEKLFYANSQGAEIFDLSIIIWLCTDDTASLKKSRPEIERILRAMKF